MSKQQYNEQENREQKYNSQEYNEQEIRERRALRIQQMKKEKQQRIMLQNCLKITVPVAAVILFVTMIAIGIGNHSVNASSLNENETAQKSANETVQQAALSKEEALQQDDTDGSQFSQQDDAAGNQVSQQDQSTETDTLQPNTGTATADTPASITYSADATAETISLSDSDIVSQHAIFIDLESGSILAKRDADTIISPASMTKILTILVAAEHITEAQLDDTFTMSLEITDYGYVNDCSSAGFLDGETVTVRDLFYGTILPSGADAAVGLATYVAGSQEAFVELMNEKLAELNLSETAHVTNCVGIYDEEHYCTVYDMAMIMEAAIANTICKEAMTAHTYTTSITEQHPEGILLSNWFLRRIEDKDTGGEVICAKTGYVVQSGNCAASYGTDHNGKEYICVTANATSNWKCIYDHVDLYKRFSTADTLN